MSPSELAEIEARLAIGESGGDLTGVLLARALWDIRLLLAEVRRLTPVPKTARWEEGSGSFKGCTVLRSKTRVVAYYYYVMMPSRWRSCAGQGSLTVNTESEARAHIETWAKARGYAVREAGEPS